MCENKASDNFHPLQGYDIRSFTTECLQRSVLYRPRNLEVCDTETAQHTREVQQRTDFTRVFREAVVRVRI